MLRFNADRDRKWRVLMAGSVVAGGLLTSGMPAQAGPVTFAVGDTVWFDAVADGVHDPAERPVGGVTVELLGGSWQVLARTWTDPIGRYAFDGLGAGTYALRFTGLPAGAAFTRRSGKATPSTDSDPDPATGVTAPFALTTSAPNVRPTRPGDAVAASYVNLTVDAGLVRAVGR